MLFFAAAGGVASSRSGDETGALGKRHGGWLAPAWGLCALVLCSTAPFWGLGGCKTQDSAVCGDGVCEGDEAQQGCLQDCPPIACGDGLCSSEETVAMCPMDCFCGNGTCDPGETWGTCPQDCGSGFCGDGYCQPDEDQASCAQDCFCGNGSCDAGESPADCLPDCHGPYCGDGVCDADETTMSCAEDCPWYCDHPVCDLWPQCGCPAGEKCVVDGQYDRSCVPSGPAAEGEVCAHPDDCEEGTLCMELATGTGVYLCARFCGDDGDCQSGPGSICAESVAVGPSENQPICTFGCDPIGTDGCPTGSACFVYVLTDGRAGSQCFAPPGTSTGTCSANFQCAPGMVCDGYDWTCRYYCRRNLGNGDCPSGQSCYRFSEPIEIDGTEYGVCAP